MARSKHKPSLSSFIEQTAKMLRNSVKVPLQKGKKAKGSISNRIEQIAFLLRSESKKRKSKKKKKY